MQLRYSRIFDPVSVTLMKTDNPGVPDAISRHATI
jgi:hypothetical protein